MSTFDETHGQAEIDQAEQWQQADTLIDRGLADPLDEGYVAPDNWSVGQGFGNTVAEARQGETIDQRIKQEMPEHDPNKLTGPWNPNNEDREVGTKRAGRLVDTGNGYKVGTDKDVVAEDVGIAGGAATAEEAAMHIIEDTQLAGQNEDHEPETEHHQPRAAK